MKPVRAAMAGKALLKFVLAPVCFAAAICASAATRAQTEIGTLQGASYRIDVPARWNHQLVVFYHGTSESPVVFSAKDVLSPMFDGLLARGYAVLQSGYSEGGWAIEAGARDTERLRRHFIAHHGRPVQTWLMGMSMGGTLIARTAEAQPKAYAGALSLCGAVQPSDALLNQGFALRVAFDYYFPGLLGPLVPVPGDYRADDKTVAKIQAALDSNPKATQALLRWYGAADEKNLAAIIADAGDDTLGLQHRLHGNPFDNANLIYVGSGDDYALNDGVHRYRADARAAAWLSRWYTPSGRLLMPMLELHDTADPLVPAGGVFDYALLVQRAGFSDHFVQQYVNREGHCVFTPRQIDTAFDELVDWVDRGRRPAPGKLPPSSAEGAAQ
ncbi:MAG TPA: alpha/beta hydrolase [Rhodanobacteraceae bacterium]